MSKTKYLIGNNLKGKIKKKKLLRQCTEAFRRRLSTPSRRQNPAVPICFLRFYPKVILHSNHSNEVAEQNFTVVQFILLYKMVLTFALVNENQNVTIEMKATDRELRVGWGGGGGGRGNG